VAPCETGSVPSAQTEREPLVGLARVLPRRRSGLRRRRTPAAAAGARRSLWWPTLLLAGVVCFITFYAKGGLNFEFNLQSVTVTEVVLTLAGSILLAVAIVSSPLGTRVYGFWPVALLLAFAVLTAVSVVWSVQPDNSWQDAGRMFAYSTVFAAAVALVRMAPACWPAILGGLALATVVVCVFALLSKVFPGELAPVSPYARLEEPFGYWNALGLTAGIGSICCLWLGARRRGHALLSAMAYPAMGLLLCTLLLAYSRGALAALAVGLVLWFCIVPLRLRGASVLILGALGGGAVAAWDFSKHALSAEGVPLAERAAAGHQLGALLLAMVALLSVVGVAIGFLTGKRAPSLPLRRNAGALLLALVVLAVLAGAGALAHSHRGLTGTVSHAVDTLTNPDAKPPPNTPGRLTAVASVRARYWKEALQIFEAHPLLGAGASGYAVAQLRYRTAAIEVKNAHGFVVQTLADLGAIGLALALAVLLAWMGAAGRATHPFDRRWTSWAQWLAIRNGGRPGWRRAPHAYTPERIAMLSMLCIVVVFGVHSFVDWTWYVPGDAFMALLCAGWVAGRGPLSVAPDGVYVSAPLSEPAASAPARGPLAISRWRTVLPAQAGYVRVALAGAVIVAALLAAWSQWEPQRSVNASQEALALLARNPGGALSKAQSAVSRDPLSAQALFTLATVQQASGHGLLARATLQHAVRLQPSNPQTWLTLARYDLLHGDPREAVQELQAVIYLNPEVSSPEALAKEREAVEIHNDYIQALQAAGTAATSTARSSSTPPAAARLKNARGPRGRAGHGAPKVAPRRRAPLLPGSGSPLAGP
jgi:O-antigen ligase/polysaccharide polymerase Wzy-like membrane protein